MPAEGVCKRPHADILSVEELVEISKAAVACGVKKIRLTGGEPLVRQGILDICSEIPQLEFLGFDVAITEDGMRLPEINRNPGYPMIETFRRPTIDYLLYKKEAKMKANNIKKTKW